MIHSLTHAAVDGMPQDHITPRQREVLRLLAQGKSMKEAAALLNVETGTVAYHKYGMMRALRLKSNAELLRFAVKKQIE